MPGETRLTSLFWTIYSQLQNNQGNIFEQARVQLTYLTKLVNYYFIILKIPKEVGYGTDFRDAN